MADGKWLNDLVADTPLPEAARLVLLVRLRVVGDHLPRALHEADGDPEYVHQLRVGTRRADAALRIFCSCLPHKVYKKARRRLRKIRRAAGAARDWDVFLTSLARGRKTEPAKNQPGIDFLLGYAAGQRSAAQADLEAVGEKLLPGFDRFVSRTVDEVRAPHDQAADATLLDLARPVLTGLLDKLEQAAAGDLADYAQLHRVRIAGKRLRYAMEVFASCFEPSFREALYPQVEEMQEILGLANDSHVAGELLAGLRDRLRGRPPRRRAGSNGTATGLPDWPRLEPGIAGLLRLHQRRLPRERRRFLKWWQHWQKTGAEAMRALTTGEGPCGPPVTPIS
jgi:CHAD domain-containing protein